MQGNVHGVLCGCFMEKPARERTRCVVWMFYGETCKGTYTVCCVDVLWRNQQVNLNVMLWVYLMEQPARERTRCVADLC